MSELCENYWQSPAIIGPDRKHVPWPCSPISTYCARSRPMVSQLSQHSTSSGRGRVGRWRGGRPRPGSMLYMDHRGPEVTAGGRVPFAGAQSRSFRDSRHRRSLPSYAQADGYHFSSWQRFMNPWRERPMACSPTETGAGCEVGTVRTSFPPPARAGILPRASSGRCRRTPRTAASWPCAASPTILPTTCSWSGNGSRSYADAGGLMLLKQCELLLPPATPTA